MKQWQIFLMAGLFLAVFSSFENAEAASPVSISVDQTYYDIVEGGQATATLTLNNTDTRYRTMEVFLYALWPAGTSWTSSFTDTNYDELANNEVNLTKGGSATVLFTMYCDANCEGGDTNVVLISAKTDPRWYPNGNNASDENNTCGSDDCETDTSPVSASVNLTNTVTMTFTVREAYTPPVSISFWPDISVDQNHFDIMEGEQIHQVLRIENTDMRYKTMEVFLSVNWPSGTAWTSRFTDANYDELANNEVSVWKGGNATVLFIVFCEANCESGDTNAVQINALTDPRWYPNGNNASDKTNTCGSDDCETDTSPASASSNFTNTITMTFTARMAYDSVVNCGAISFEGGNEVTPGNVTGWAYTLENVGWNTDNYQFIGHIISADGHNVSLWSITPGMANGKELTGADPLLSGVSIAASSMQFTPALTASPGTYTVELTVISYSGGPDTSCAFDVVIPVEEVVEEEPIEEEIEEEVPSISMIPALITIGLIAIFRRK